MPSLNPPFLPVALNRIRHRQGGQSVVEFAVVLPVFILIIMGILYFGRYENYSNQETQLAEQGARWAAINYATPGCTFSSPSNTECLESYIQNQASGELLNGSGDVITPVKAYIYYAPSGQTSAVRVCVTAQVRIALPIFTTNVWITQASTMHVEQAATASGNWTADTPPSQCPTT